MTILLIIVIIAALVFDYINGFHDAANSIATIVSTKVLTPLQAVVWAAAFNFLAFFIFTEHGVANTIAKTVKDVQGPDGEFVFITLPVILSGLIAAIFWNLLTWWFGIPSSSSHTLIGGFAGAAVAHGGFPAINLDVYPNILHTALFIFLAPLVGMIFGYLISQWFLHSFSKSIWPKVFSLSVLILTWLFISMMIHNRDVELLSGLWGNTNANLASKISELHLPPLAVQAKSFGQLLTDSHNIKWLLIGSVVTIIGVSTLFMSRLNHAKGAKIMNRLQLVSSAALSIGHGGNDAQKVMGIIMVALLAGHQVADISHMPDWVPLACYSAIALGTLSGGWKIIKTMGTRITKVSAFEGVAAETAGAMTLFMTENLKIPVSTTHTITGSIIGVGATKRLSAVRWGVTVSLLWAWILTIPVSAGLAAGVYWIFQLFL